MSEKLSSVSLRDFERGPELDRFGSGIAADSQPPLAERLKQDVAAGAVPLISSLEQLTPNDVEDVMEAVEKHPDRMVVDSMVAQAEMHISKRQKREKAGKKLAKAAINES